MSNSIAAPFQIKAKTQGKGSLEINYYRASQTTAADLERMCCSAATAVAADEACQASDWAAALVAMLRLAPVEELLLHISHVQIFNHDLHRDFSHNLVLLGLLKKLKYWYVLPQSTFLQCFNDVASALGVEAPALTAQAEAALASCVQLKVSVVCRQESMKCYLDNERELEKAEPHAICPTSEFRACDGQVLATEDASLIEGVMSTTITTTIRIISGVLDPENHTLRNVYAPKGRCVAVVDEQVEALFGARIDTYFKTHNIPLYKLVCSGMEAGKNMQAVGTILKTLKTHSVARNEPVLIVGGGVISDLGGFATGLYDRNTPYVMLCTSIVAGIDAGPSPRTCANDFGYKNLYGAFHPPVLTLTDRTLWSTLHEGWLRHGIAEIIKMAVVKDWSLFELLEDVGPRLIYTKFGNTCPEDAEFCRKCDLIVGKAMHSYVRSEYGNLYETHQCRPHAYGHTWCPGYELPAGMLHGHAVGTCMGYGAFLAMRCDFISQAQMERVMKLISNFELSLWHPIMDSADRIWDCTKKIIAKRGGFLCAPVPRGEIGSCGYIQDLTYQQVGTSIQEYRELCESFPRGGLGVEVHCREVGLEDPSKVDYCKPEDTIRELRAENAALRAMCPPVSNGKRQLPALFNCGCEDCEPENLKDEEVASTQNSETAGCGLEDALGEEVLDKDLLGILSAIARSVADIGVAMREGIEGFAARKTDTQNTFGDEQLAVDLASDAVVFARLKESGLCSVASSEETTKERPLGGSKYCVGFDPLDGSSVVDVNFSVGSIFGIWEGATLMNRTGREQKAAVIAMYGPRITMAVAISSQKVVELTFQGNAWVVTKQQMKIASEGGRVFAPGNLRATADNKKYDSLVQLWLQDRYTLRYTGALVPDVYHILHKGRGIIVNCSSPQAKAKLRLLYECAPIAFIVEAAGGKSTVDPAFSNGEKMSVLDLVVDDLDKRVGICYGGIAEVEKFEQHMF